MGIAGFFGYFFNENKLLKQNEKFINEEIVNMNVNKLYIDFVNIIHDILAENKDLDNGDKSNNSKIILKIIERLSTLFNFYPNAEKLIFFECIPTIAKIKEQYSRRMFKKIQNDIEINLKKRLGCEINKRFDQENFSIDSDFFIQIKKAIEDHFLDDKIKIFTHSKNEIGEAEHRIINHIATNCSSNNSNDADKLYVIYSPDADVFLLGTILTNLLSNKFKSNIIVNTLRRSDSTTNRVFYSIDTIKFSNHLIKKMNLTQHKQNNFTYDILNDITFIFNLLGDDFIPVFDKFKLLHSSEIFNVIFNVVNQLNQLDQCKILEYDENISKFKINKTNLLKLFEKINNHFILQNDQNNFNQKNYKSNYKYYLQTNHESDIKIKYNELVFLILQDAFQKGFYIYEKSLYSNKNNFYVNKSNKNKIFTEITSKFIIYDFDKNKKQYEITINKKYKMVSIIDIDNNQSINKINKTTINSTDKSNDIILNYFEGYEFILDLYYNNIGFVSNNFWYYKHNCSPSLDITIKWLKNNDLPSYIVENKNNTKYFTTNKYKNFLASLLDVNYKKILKKINKKSITYDDIVFIKTKSFNNIFNKIFNCFEKKYINKCEIKDDQFLNPFDFI